MTPLRKLRSTGQAPRPTGPVSDSPAIGAALSGLWVQLALLVTGIAAARILGVEDRGQFAILWLLPLALAGFLNLGLPLGTIYYLARHPGASRSISMLVRPLVAIQLVAVLLIHGGLLAVLLPGQPAEVQTSGLVSLAWGPMILLQLYGLALLQGRSEFRRFNILRVVPTTAYAVALAGVLVAGEGSLLGFTAAAVGANVFAGLLTLRVGLRSLPRRDSEPAPVSRREIASFGAKSLFGSFSAVETLQADQIFVGLVLSPAALGFYVVASAFINLPRFVATSIGMVGFPQVASLADREQARRQIWRVVGLTMSLCLAFVAVLELTVGWIVPLVFGAEFEPAVPVARILLLACLLLCARRVLGDAVRGAGHPWYGTIAEAASWIWLFPALVVGANAAGVEGAAWATLSTYFVALMVLLALVLRRPELRPRARPTMAAAAPAASAVEADIVEPPRP